LFFLENNIISSCSIGNSTKLLILVLPAGKYKDPIDTILEVLNCLRSKIRMLGILIVPFF